MLHWVTFNFLKVYILCNLFFPCFSTQVNVGCVPKKVSARYAVDCVYSPAYIYKPTVSNQT